MTKAWLQIGVMVISGMLCTATTAEVEVQVSRGDNLVRLLRANGVDRPYADLLPMIAACVKSNPHAFVGSDPNRLRPGVTLRLPIAVAQETIAVQPSVGAVVVTQGSARARILGEQRTIVGTMALHAGDEVTTAAESRAVLQFSDGGSIELGPLSQFRIKEFEAPSANVPGNSLLNLVKGAMRAITGMNGKSPGSRYQLETVTATIGVRGTEYVARFCSVDCGRLVGTSVGVAEGVVVLANASGQLELPAGQFARVESADAAPRNEPVPEGFFDLGRSAEDIAPKKSWFQQLLDRVRGWLGA